MPQSVKVVRFRVLHYRCFRNIELDLRVRHDYNWAQKCLTDAGDLVKTPLIMGEIASGKSSIISAMADAAIETLPGTVRQKAISGIINADTNAETAEFEWTLAGGAEQMIYRYSRKADGSMSGEEMIGADTQGRSEACADLRRSEGPDCVPVFPGCKIIRAFFENIVFLTRDEQGPVLCFRGELVRSPFEILARTEQAEAFAELLVSLGIGCSRLRDALRKLNGRNGSARRIEAVLAEQSDGIRQLAFLFSVLTLENASLILIDDFDDHLTLDAAKAMLMRFREETAVQTIITARSPELLSTLFMRPDTVFRVSHGELKVLPKLTQRELRKGINIPKLWRAGEFG